MTWTDKLPEIVIGSVLITGGGYLINQLVAMNRTIGSLEAELKAKFTENTSRIDRIAAALPDLRIRIAKEELSKPATAIVVATVPAKNQNGKWSKNINILDVQSQKLYSYVLPAKGPEDDTAEWQVVGKAVMHDQDATSFAQLSRFAKDVEGMPSIPAYVNGQASYLRAPNYPFAVMNNYLKPQALSSYVHQLPQGGYAYQQFVPQLARNQGVFYSAQQPLVRQPQYQPGGFSAPR